MHKNPLVYVVAFLVVLSLEKCFAEPVFLELSEAPKDGLVVCPIDLTPAANWLGVDKMPLVEFYSGDRKLDAIFVSGSENPLRGTFVAVLPDDVPKGKPCRLRIGNPDGGGKAEFSVPPVADSAAAKIFFDAKKLGGLPSKILFNKNEKNLESLKWFDRLHDPATGSWNISNDKNASVEVIEAKPFLTVVRTAAAFQRPDGSTPSSKPQALYDWFFFPQRELVYVVADWKQNEPTEWKEKHFLELHIPDGSFSKWFGDDKSGTFTGSQNSQTFSRYSGFLDDQNNVIATIAPGTVLYDGLNSFGPYLMPRGHDAWKP